MPKLLLVLTATALLTPSGCAAVSLNPTTWEVPSLFASESAPVGSATWWKRQKGKAEFVPGEGFRVTGVEGYFDQEGRPIQAKVAKTIQLEESKGILQDVKVSATMADFKRQVGRGPDEQQAKLVFAKGEDLFHREKYAAAAKQFKQTISRWPNSSLAQDAMFLMAESHFYHHDYPEAIETYNQLLKANPNSKHLDKIVRRQFRIARYWEKHHQHEPHWATTPNMFDDTRPFFDTLGRSLKIYENIRLNDPTGPLADDAIMATANSYFMRGRYNDADYHYELVRTEYPRSESQFEAHILGLQCKLRKYQGPDYDGTPLLEAKRLVKQIKIQFAGNLNDEEKGRLQLDEADLQKQLAARDWKLAKHYEENGFNTSAQFYYAKVMRNFKGTPIANDAQQAYAALEGLPGRPPVKMESIINMLPENAERQAIAQVPLIEAEPKLDPTPNQGLARQPESPGGESDGPLVR